MVILRSFILALLPLATYARAPALEPRADDAALKTPVKTTVCKGKSYTFQELSGYGFVPSDARDKYGDTISLGSSIAIERSSWKKLREGYYEGTLWGLPDRGWYVCSTLGIYRDILTNSTMQEYAGDDSLPATGPQVQNLPQHQSSRGSITTKPHLYLLGHSPLQRSCGQSYFRSRPYNIFALQWFSEPTRREIPR